MFRFKEVLSAFYEIYRLHLTLSFVIFFIMTKTKVMFGRITRNLTPSICGPFVFLLGEFRKAIFYYTITRVMNSESAEVIQAIYSCH